MTKEKEMRRLIQKLETENDISFEESKWIYSLMGSLIETVSKMSLPIPISNSEELELQELLSNDYDCPVLALKDWHDAVARKIKAGYSGNFIFTLRLAHGISAFDRYWRPAIVTLGKYGCFEDRVASIGVNKIVYSSLPEYVQPLFDFEIYGLRFMESSRAGMFRYPRKIPGADETYTLSQIFKKMPLVPVISGDSEVHMLTNISNDYDYIIKYLQQRIIFGKYEVKLFSLATFMRYENIPCAAAVDTYNSKFTIFTEKDRALIVKHALEIPFEELAQNAVKEKVIDKQMAKELINDYPIVNFPMKNFAEASAKYIDGIVQKQLKWQAEWRKVEYEPEWLEEIR